MKLVSLSVKLVLYKLKSGFGIMNGYLTTRIYLRNGITE
ncbi:hypothetical protein L21SP2_2362 [Salinispira pacifica]|uniref:Uncharacterized protein n=1 Tax=Salinispira pacifica TaxID=1307761 RepID=V5WJA4_9SPIO|nr:hypothetical protein L21SP2_2362 [Salinispira pacifica]